MNATAGSAAPAASQANQYSVRRAEFPADRERLIDLWRGNISSPARLEHKFEWFYADSPTGEPLTMLLWHNAEPAGASSQSVGTAAAGPRQFLLGDEPVKAAVLVDMAVDPAHRTLFPALYLQKTMREAALAEGPILYGFPNPKAVPVVVRTGYRKLGSMTRYVRVLRSAEYLRSRMPAWAAAPVGALWDTWARLRFAKRGRGNELALRWPDTDGTTTFEPQARSVAGRPLLQGLRTTAFLRWRFASSTERKFDFVGLYRSSDSLGYWIVEPIDRVLHVRDCPVALLIGETAMSAWTLLFAEARKRAFRSVSFECLSTPDIVASLGRLGMRPRSERPVFGVVREDHVSRVATAEWYLTAADEDE